MPSMIEPVEPGPQLGDEELRDGRVHPWLVAQARRVASKPLHRDVRRLAHLWSEAGHVVVLTGAGISTDSGIKDFRGPDGIWTRDPKAMEMFTLQPYLCSSEVRQRAWRFRRDSGMFEAQPNDGHLTLAALQRTGRIEAIMTQNVDGLHQRGGCSGVLELHGTVWEVGCLSCGHLWPTPEIMARNEVDPRCARCGGVLKHATIAFGQHLDPAVLQAAHQAVSAADLLVAIGTSLEVHPVASLADVAEHLAIINAQPTARDCSASVVVRGGITETLKAVASEMEPR